MAESDTTLGDSLGSDDTLSRSTLGAASTRELVDVAPGTTIDRYLVIGKLGAGAMGVVLAAYDPVLDRKVAIKLLTSQADHETARARLQREAQALAKLDHPNVVGVHDVGLHGDRLFVAMDFVDGCTLGTWMTAEPRDWRAVVARFVEAGRGLAAAHDAGLVHRDFKPDNVMLGADCRVRVLDFGLARPHLDGAGSRRAQARFDEFSHAAATLEATSGSNTRPGALVGTPAYMALEIWDGQPANARSDQFSFCVALYEALYGERPFAADNLLALLDVLATDRVRAPPRGSSVPPWLRKVVVRGLARDPAQRWPTMRALLDALLDDPSLRRRRLVIAIAAPCLLGALIVGAFMAAPREAGACEGLDAPLAGVWDEARAERLARAFDAAGLAHASETWTRVEPRIDAYARDWVSARVTACEATQRGEQSGETLDRRMACLDQRLEHLDATLDELERADATVVERAVQAVIELPSLERCSDLDLLAQQQPPPDDPALAQRVHELDDEIIAAVAKGRAGRYAEALASMREIVKRAEALGHEPLQVRAWLEQGKVQDLTGDYDDALVSLERAYEGATGLRMIEEAAAAATWSMYVSGYQLGRTDALDRWDVHARALARALGTARAEAEYLDTHGALASARGDYAVARADQERALALEEARLGPEHPTLAIYLNGLGIVADLQGDFAFARTCHARALAIRIAAFGPDHPVVANSHGNLGVIDFQEGDFAAARAHFERAVEIAEASLGPNHPDLADVLQNLSETERMLGNYSAARVHGQRVLAIQLDARGPDHPLVANAIGNLATIAYEEDDLDTSRSLHERSLALRERIQGTEHPALAGPLMGLAAIARTQDRFAEGEAYATRALAIQEAALGSDHPDLAVTLTLLGWLQIDQGRSELALSPLERALALRLAHQGDPDVLAETRFALAHALWDAPPEHGRDRTRARELAEATRAAWTAPTSNWGIERDWVEGWLATHRE